MDAKKFNVSSLATVLNDAKDALSKVPEVGANPYPPRQEHLYYRYVFAVGAIFCIGFLVRGLYVFSTDFPLNDGGMFYAMVQDIQRANYALPVTSSYNGLGLAFAYSPLAFYAAALIDDLTPFSLIQAFQYIPLIASGLTVVAFYLLANALLSSRRTVLAATFAYAVVPSSFTWLIMGGGLTRSPGLLFAILALWQVYVFYTTRRWRHALLAALFCGLTVLSHLGTASFLAFSIVVFFLARGRHREGVFGSAVIALGAILISAPWLATVMAHHGLEPFLAARTSGSLSEIGGFKSLIIRFLRLGAGTTFEPLFPVILVLSLAGVFVCLSQRRYLFPGWWAAVFFLEHRAFETVFPLPLALLAGIGFTELVRGVASMVRDTHPSHLARAVPVLLVCVFVGYTVVGALTGLRTSSPGLIAGTRHLVSLTPDDRAAMNWVAHNTDPDSRFLVITGNGWESLNRWAGGTRNGWWDDRVSEWFPALTSRPSVATVQAYEWLPNKAFGRQIRAYNAAQRCASWGAGCIEEWSRTQATPVTHLYIPKRHPSVPVDMPCCGPLLESLVSDARFRVVYDGPGAVIFARVPPAG